MDRKTLLESTSHIKDNYVFVFNRLLAWENPVA